MDMAFKVHSPFTLSTLERTESRQKAMLQLPDAESTWVPFGPTGHMMHDRDPSLAKRCGTLRLAFLCTTAMYAILFLALLARTSAQSFEVTIDDNNDGIVYEGVWEPASIHTSPLNIGPGHALSSTGGTATFRFSGIAAAYLAPLWPYPVDSVVTLDGESTLVDLRDYTRSTPDDGGPETVQSAVVWNRTGLLDTEHTMVISRAPLPGGLYTVVDALRYTTGPNGPVPLSSSSASETTSSAMSTETQQNSSANDDNSGGSNKAATIGIAVGSAVGALALLGFLFFFLCRRRRRANARKNKPDLLAAEENDKYLAPTPFVTGAYDPYQQHSDRSPSFTEDGVDAEGNTTPNHTRSQSEHSSAATDAGAAGVGVGALYPAQSLSSRAPPRSRLGLVDGSRSEKQAVAYAHAQRDSTVSSFADGPSYPRSRSGSWASSTGPGPLGRPRTSSYVGSPLSPVSPVVERDEEPLGAAVIPPPAYQA